MTVTSAPRSSVTSDQLYHRAVKCLPGGNTRSTLFVPPHPPYAASGRGCVVVDVDGHEVLDLQGNYTALIHGHARREIVEAAVSAIQDGSCFSLPTSSEVELAEELSRRIASGERWRFTNSGTEAVMMALRLARRATGRPLILRFAGCYHGSYDGALEPGPAGEGRDVISVPVGDADAVRAAFEQHGERIACVLFDAMPNRAGLRPAAPEFVAFLRQETDRYGSLLVLDEVITFRIAFGGLQSLYALRPDITTLGKVIGGGFPVGAFGGRADLLERFDPARSEALVHGGTFSANPVSMRAGLVSLQLLTEDEISRINALGDRLRTELCELGWTVTGRGSLFRIHARDPAALWWRLYAGGLMIAANGLGAISTAITDAEIDRALTVFEQLKVAE